jgi:alpha-N-arabinofuranosidase
MYETASKYDSYDRKGPKIFVGEWATREGAPTTNMNAALGDAAWMTGMERNSDIVIMSCYAPLFVNVNPGGMQWKSDLIGYNALNCYGSPSYYAQKMFSNYLGDNVIPSTFENMPLQQVPTSAKDSAAGHIASPVPTLFSVTTKDSKTGTIYIKVVNTINTSQQVSIRLEGLKKISSKAQAITLKSDKPEDTNSIKEPQKIIPVITSVNGVSKNFSYKFPAYSVTVIKLATNIE